MGMYYGVSFGGTLLLEIIFSYLIFKRVKWFERLLDFLKSPMTKMVYYFMMFLSSFVYIAISIKISVLTSEWSAAINPIILLFVLWVTNLMFEKMIVEDYVDIWYKKWAIVLSYMSIVVAGIAMCKQHNLLNYFMVSSIAIGVLVGAYIPIDNFLKLTSFKELVKKGVKHLKSQLKHTLEIIFSCIVSGVLLILCLSQKIDVVEQIFEGIGTGASAFFLIFMIYIWYMKKNKKG